MFKTNPKKRKGGSSSELNPPRKKRKFNAPKFGNLPTKSIIPKSSTQLPHKSSSLSTSTRALSIKPKNTKRKFVPLMPKQNAPKKPILSKNAIKPTTSKSTKGDSKQKKTENKPKEMKVRKGKNKFKFVRPKIADKVKARKHFGIDDLNDIYGAVFGCLGMRREKTTLPKHDADAENALVLWRPEELSESDTDNSDDENENKEEESCNNETNEDNKFRIAVKKNALAIKAASKQKKKGKKVKVPIVVDPRLSDKLRSHQVVGVEFVYRCMMDKKYAPNNQYGEGCILADGMGLGKTLQAITVMWTLLEQDVFAGEQTCKNGIVICPATLVENWQNEIYQWLGKIGNKTMKPYACLTKTKDVIKSWLSVMKSTHCMSKPVLIISYESFRSYHEQICWKTSKKPSKGREHDPNFKNDIGFVVCDEGHRLKNHKSQLSVAVSHIKSRKRLLLSGTPIQNDLKEMYSLVNFVNPGVWEDVKDFSKSACKIVRSFDSSAKKKAADDGTKALSSVRKILDTFLLQRTSKVVMKYLPQKNEYIVFCKLTDIQQQLYQKFLSSKAAKQAQNTAAGGGLSAIGFLAVAVLNKLCNHPALIYEASAQIAKVSINKGKWKLVSAASKGKGKKKKKRGKKSVIHNTSDSYDKHGNRIRTELKGLYELYPTDFINTYYKAQHSSKMTFTISLLLQLKHQKTGDKTVIVSVYAETLDILALVLEKNCIEYKRLDGSIPTKKRQPIVDEFNDPNSKYLVLLLSNRAGGCGLNLIGANRLIMYDADWNPANDAQAMARVWRSGQLKKTYIYRLFSTGTLEEKIFQRQTFKSDLAEQLVAAEEDMTDMTEFAVKELKNIFKYNKDTICDTLERTNNGGYIGWNKVKHCVNVGDPFLTRAAKPGKVTFLFHRIVNDPKLKMDQENNENNNEQKCEENENVINNHNIKKEESESENENDIIMNDKENNSKLSNRRRSSSVKSNKINRSRSSSISSIKSNGRRRSLSINRDKSKDMMDYESESPLISKRRKKKQLKNNKKVVKEKKKIIQNGKKGNNKGNNKTNNKKKGMMIDLCDSDEEDYENYSVSDGDFKPNDNSDSESSSDSDSDSY